MSLKYKAALLVGIFALLLGTPVIASHTYASSYIYQASVSPSTNVGLGTTVTITASTNDPSVTAVSFTWVSAVPTTTNTVVSTVTCGTSKCATNSLALSSAGLWQVTMIFYNTSGKVHSIVAGIFVFINVTPEFPSGILTAIIAPLAAFGTILFAKKRQGIKALFVK